MLNSNNICNGSKIETFPLTHNDYTQDIVLLKDIKNVLCRKYERLENRLFHNIIPHNINDNADNNEIVMKHSNESLFNLLNKKLLKTNLFKYSIEVKVVNEYEEQTTKSTLLTNITTVDLVLDCFKLNSRHEMYEVDNIHKIERQLRRYDNIYNTVSKWIHDSNSNNSLVIKNRSSGNNEIKLDDLIPTRYPYFSSQVLIKNTISNKFNKKYLFLVEANLYLCQTSDFGYSTFIANLDEYDVYLPNSSNSHTSNEESKQYGFVLKSHHTNNQVYSINVHDKKTWSKWVKSIRYCKNKVMYETDHNISWFVNNMSVNSLLMDHKCFKKIVFKVPNHSKFIENKLIMVNTTNAYEFVKDILFPRSPLLNNNNSENDADLVISKNSNSSNDDEVPLFALNIHKTTSNRSSTSQNASRQQNRLSMMPSYSSMNNKRNTLMTNRTSSNSNSPLLRTTNGNRSPLFSPNLVLDANHINKSYNGNRNSVLLSPLSMHTKPSYETLRSLNNYNYSNNANNASNNNRLSTVLNSGNKNNKKKVNFNVDKTKPVENKIQKNNIKPASSGNNGKEIELRKSRSNPTITISTNTNTNNSSTHNNIKPNNTNSNSSNKLYNRLKNKFVLNNNKKDSFSELSKSLDAFVTSRTNNITMQQREKISQPNNNTSSNHSNNHQRTTIKTNTNTHTHTHTHTNTNTNTKNSKLAYSSNENEMFSDLGLNSFIMNLNPNTKEPNENATNINRENKQNNDKQLSFSQDLLSLINF